MHHDWSHTHPWLTALLFAVALYVALSAMAAWIVEDWRMLFWLVAVLLHWLTWPRRKGMAVAERAQRQHDALGTDPDYALYGDYPPATLKWEPQKAITSKDYVQEIRRHRARLDVGVADETFVWQNPVIMLKAPTPNTPAVYAVEDKGHNGEPILIGDPETYLHTLGER